MHTFSDQEFIVAVEQAFSIREALRLLGLCASGNAYTVFKRRVASLQLDTSHFTGQAHRRGWQKPVIVSDLQSLLTTNSSSQSYQLKNRLFKSGLKSKICESCSLDKWMGEMIPLELDHINGISSDNRLENLRILCPNCHAQTPTHAGKNKNRVP